MTSRAYPVRNLGLTREEIEQERQAFIDRWNEKQKVLDAEIKAMREKARKEIEAERAKVRTQKPMPAALNRFMRAARVLQTISSILPQGQEKPVQAGPAKPPMLPTPTFTRSEVTTQPHPGAPEARPAVATEGGVANTATATPPPYQYQEQIRASYPRRVSTPWVFDSSEVSAEQIEAQQHVSSYAGPIAMEGIRAQSLWRGTF